MDRFMVGARRDHRRERPPPNDRRKSLPGKAESLQSPAAGGTRRRGDAAYLSVCLH
jgi:hypothetical protein